MSMNVSDENDHDSLITKISSYENVSYCQNNVVTSLAPLLRNAATKHLGAMPE
jgi:hypothetical protein